MYKYLNDTPVSLFENMLGMRDHYIDIYIFD